MTIERNHKRLYGIKSKYTGVCYTYSNSNRVHYWRFSFKKDGLVAQMDFPFTEDGERKAAIMYDKKLLENGKDPVNILKRKV